VLNSSHGMRLTCSWFTLLDYIYSSLRRILRFFNQNFDISY
jgi:hypothetical protein